jgi:short-subunit dehydrogenase
MTRRAFTAIVEALGRGVEAQALDSVESRDRGHGDPWADPFPPAGVQNSELFRSAMDAATVAQAGYDGAMAGRRVVIPGLMNRLRVLVARLVPRRVSTAIARRLNRTPG